MKIRQATLSSFSYDQIEDRKVRLALMTIVLAGAALRIYHLNFQSLWYDELHSIVGSGPDRTLSQIIEYSKTDQPPLFFIYLHFFLQVFGNNEISGRMAVVLVGVLGIPAMYILGKEARGNAVGLFAALLTSLNYFHIYYSQELRFYSASFLLTTLSFIFLIRAIRGSRILHFALYSLVTTALLYTHYYGLVIFGAQSIIFIVVGIISKSKRLWWLGSIAGLVVIALFIPWLPVILNDLQIESFWLQKPEPTFVVNYFYQYFGKDILATATCTLLLWIFFKAFFDPTGNTAQNRIFDLIIIIWLFASYLIPYIKSLIGPPLLHVRYTIVSLPAWIIIFSVGWHHITNKKWKSVVVVALSISMVLNTFLIRKHYTKVNKQQFREVSELVKEKNSDNTPILSQFAWHYNFYFRNDSTKVIDVNRVDFDTLQRFWLLQAEFFSPQEKQQELNAYETNFQVVEVYPFFKTEATLLTRKK